MINHQDTKTPSETKIKFSFNSKIFLVPWCAAPQLLILRAVLPRMIRTRIMNQGCLGGEQALGLRGF